VTFGQIEAMAAHLVETHWPAITRVAAALVVEGELAPFELERLRDQSG
jgi:hypothetical protein